MLEAECRSWKVQALEDVVFREFVEHSHWLGMLCKLSGLLQGYARGLYDHTPLCLTDFDCSVFGHRHRKRAEVLPRVSAQRRLLKKSLMFLRLLHHAHHGAENPRLRCRDRTPLA